MMYVRDGGDRRARRSGREARAAIVLDDDDVDRLVALGERIEDHYETPQDVEWAIYDDDVYLLQSRPITTIDEAIDAPADGERPPVHRNGRRLRRWGRRRRPGRRRRDDNQEEGILADGLGAGPGTASGDVRIVTKLDQLDKVESGDIIVTEMTTPDMVPAMKRAAGLVTDEGRMTSRRHRLA